MGIPKRIHRILDGKQYIEDDIGRSGSRILLFDDYVLKIEKYREAAAQTVEVMRWLEGKLPVPSVIGYEREGDSQYLLMSRIKGKMSCDSYYLEHPEELVSLLADAMNMLWKIDISDCPRERSMEAELSKAAYRVEHQLVDLDNVEPDTFGEGGFASPNELLQWLFKNRPSYEPVLSHGDFCLPNIFLDDGRVSGFIDLGDTGVGDKWRDIALCYRSLKHNFDGTYGGKIYRDFDPDMLFEKLGIKPDREKLRYYTLLDELF